MGAIGIEVRVKDLEAVNTKIKLLNDQIWFLEQGYGERFCYLFENGKQVPVKVARVAVSELYPNIRFIFDKNNNVIAERACLGARLRTTRQNKWLSSNKKVKIDRTLHFYQLIEKIEDRQHAKKMLAHFYKEKSGSKSPKSI